MFKHIIFSSQLLVAIAIMTGRTFATAFIPQMVFHNNGKIATTTTATKSSSSLKTTSSDETIDFVPFFEPTDDLSIDRARECSEVYGKCSLTEVEQLRKKIHESRINHLDSIIDLPHEFHNDIESEEDLRSLEKDLELQLSLLSDHILPSTFFPDDTDDIVREQQKLQKNKQGENQPLIDVAKSTTSAPATMNIESHIDSSSITTSSIPDPSLESFIDQGKRMLVKEKTSLMSYITKSENDFFNNNRLLNDETVDETIIMCLVVAIIAMIPKILLN